MYLRMHTYVYESSVSVCNKKKRKKSVYSAQNENAYHHVLIFMLSIFSILIRYSVEIVNLVHKRSKVHHVSDFVPILNEFHDYLPLDTSYLFFFVFVFYFMLSFCIFSLFVYLSQCFSYPFTPCHCFWGENANDFHSNIRIDFPVELKRTRMKNECIQIIQWFVFHFVLWIC